MDGHQAPLWKQRNYAVSEEKPQPLASPARSHGDARQFGLVKRLCDKVFLERAKGFEPSTPTLAR
jgi:hypothetical protein